jgi:hypothetical protein
MSFSIYTAEAILNSLFGKTSDFGTLSSVPTIHVGLSSTTPAEDGTNVTEPSAGAYARVETAAGDWNAATTADPSVVTNLNAITFPTATATWLAGADLTYAVLYDAATTGNFLGAALLDTAKPVTDGDTAEIGAGDLSVSLD